MTQTKGRLSLYWLDDNELYLGEAACTRPSSGWFGFGAEQHGLLCVASAHFFFDDGSGSVLVFPLRALEKGTFHDERTRFVVSFACKRVMQRDVVTSPGAPSPIPGACTPVVCADVWVFQVSDASELLKEAVRRLVAQQRVEDLLHRREVALQAASSAVSFRARRQVPMREQRGVLHIAAAQLSFEPLSSMSTHGTVTLARAQCHHTFARWIVFEAVGLDVYTSDSLEEAPALSLIFANTFERDQARELMQQLMGTPRYATSMHEVAEAWKRGDVSNYAYLQHLNKWSSRCLNDAFQYPVFPWVLADYTSTQLDLSTPTTFRDLRQPIGALSADRLQLLRQRAQFLAESEEPMYLYSTHYSSAGVVAYYLVRPHPEYQLCLQGGALDVPERILESIPQLWRSVTTNTSNFRELIPAFFNDDFGQLCGPPRIPLGSHASGTAVAPFVKLPPWAASPQEFVRLHREALESAAVSAALHAWIDLVFGVAQAGELAQAADNLFHPFSYRQHGKPLSVPGLHLSWHEYAREFGNMPMQLFRDAHPARGDAVPGILSTAEAAEACGMAAMSQEQQRLLQMMAALQSIEEAAEDAETPPETPGVDNTLTSSDAVLLSEMPAVTLACTSARFVCLGMSAQSSPLSSGGSSSASADPLCQRSTAILLVVSDDARIVTLLDVSTGERLRAFRDFDGRVTHAVTHAGNMLVFTDQHICYVLSLASQAVIHCFAELTRAAVSHACVLPTAALLVDTAAQLTWWCGGATAAVPSLLGSPPTLVCEASARVLCVGTSHSTAAAAALTEEHDVFLFHDDVCEECTLQRVPDDGGILGVLPAASPLQLWLFFTHGVALCSLTGKWLRRVRFDGAAAAVVFPELDTRTVALCIHATETAMAMRVWPCGGEQGGVLPLSAGGLASPAVSCAGNTAVLVGRRAADATGSLVAVLVELRLETDTGADTSP